LEVPQRSSYRGGGIALWTIANLRNFNPVAAHESGLICVVLMWQSAMLRLKKSQLGIALGGRAIIEWYVCEYIEVSTVD
jgi:hypothetical protein